jgi:hypothetical protein
MYDPTWDLIELGIERAPRMAHAARTVARGTT